MGVTVVFNCGGWVGSGVGLVVWSAVSVFHGLF